jgi:hypothetical protein
MSSCIVTMEAGPQLTLQTAKNTSMFSAQHTSNSNSLSVEEMPQRPFSPPTKPASFLSYGPDIPYPCQINRAAASLHDQAPVSNQIAVHMPVPPLQKFTNLLRAAEVGVGVHIYLDMRKELANRGRDVVV